MSAVIPAYLGWGNAERDTASMRLYATDQDNAPRWDSKFPGGRVAEYAAIERDGGEGDRYLIVRVGNRFTKDEEMERVAEAIRQVLHIDGDRQ